MHISANGGTISSIDDFTEANRCAHDITNVRTDNSSFPKSNDAPNKISVNATNHFSFTKPNDASNDIPVVSANHFSFPKPYSLSGRPNPYFPNANPMRSRRFVTNV
jgi:hypothetical protein